MCVSACAVTGFAVDSGDSISERRIRLLRELTRDALKGRGGGGSDFRVLKTVMSKYVEVDNCVQIPKRVVVDEGDCRRASRESTRLLVRKKYPGLDMDKLKAGAAAAFPIYEPGQVVTVKYQANPLRVHTKTGVFHGREGAVLRVGLGGRPILLRDMAGLAGNDVELLKFDEKESKARRKAQIDKKVAEYEAERTAYEKTVSTLTFKAEKKRAIRTNEEAGYTFYDGEWRHLRDCATLLLERIRGEVAREQALRAKRLQRERRREIELSIVFQASFDASLPSYAYRDPKTLFARASAQTQQGTPEAGPGDEKTSGGGDTPPDKSDDAVAPEEGDGGGEESGTLVNVDDAEDVAPLQIDIGEEEAGIPLWFFAAIGGILVTSVVIVIVLLAKAKSDAPRSEAKKFFKAGAGKQQKSFWQMAEADPDGFKYVAYRYPTRELALESLVQLSYLTATAGGELRCRLSLLFGFYPHKDKFVAFVGGDELHYSLWREASALMPEIADAEYFRVSTAPDVELVIPDLQKLLADESLEITFVEEREGEGDDFAKYFIYTAPDKGHAMVFLKKAEIHSPGVHIVVQTSDGTWGRDESGIYEDEGAAEAT